MKHTSIRLSDIHLERIEATGQSPTIVIKKALDAYFNLPDEATDQARKLIDEHVNLYHRAQVAHTSLTEPKHGCEHEMSTDAKAILAYILSELREGREPTVADIAERTGLSTQMISKTLTRYEIRAKETKRGGKPGRYFIKSMKSDIESVLSKL